MLVYKKKYQSHNHCLLHVQRVFHWKYTHRIKNYLGRHWPKITNISGAQGPTSYAANEQRSRHSVPLAHIHLFVGYTMIFPSFFPSILLGIQGNNHCANMIRCATCSSVNEPQRYYRVRRTIKYPPPCGWDSFIKSIPQVYIGVSSYFSSTINFYSHDLQRKPTSKRRPPFSFHRRRRWWSQHDNFLRIFRGDILALRKHKPSAISNKRYILHYLWLFASFL